MLLNDAIISISYNRWILAFITLMIICQHFALVYGVSTDSEAEEIESDDDFVGVVEPDNVAEQQIVNEEALRMKAEFKPPKQRGNDNYESFLGLHKSHDTAMKSVDQMLPELGHQMMFANAEDLFHLKEVTKLVLFLKHVLQIIKDKKEKAKGCIDHMTDEMRFAVPEDLPKRQMCRRIEAEQRELDNLREGQKKVKKDLCVIRQAKEDKNWCFLSFIIDRKSNCAAYDNAVSDWLAQTLDDQPGNEVDRWEYVNGHLNSVRVDWKKAEAIKTENSDVLKEIRENPSEATKYFNQASLMVLRADTIMEMNVRSAFMAVATNAMRNYAALSEAMDLDEIEGYSELFHKYFHPAIKCTTNVGKQFDKKFDTKKEEEELDEKSKAKISNGFQKTFERFMNNNIFYPNWSEKRHTKEIEKTIEDYSFKTLIAPTRFERNRAMEVLKVAVFLREFYKTILPQNPDETREIEAENEMRQIEEELNEKKQKIEFKQTQIRERQAEYEAAQLALGDARSNAQLTQEERVRRAEQQREAQEAAELAQAQMAANQSPVSPLGSDSESGDEMANSRRRRRKRNDDDIENEDTARAAEVLDMLQQNIEIAQTELVDLISWRNSLQKDLSKARKVLVKAKESYQDGRRMAKRVRVYLDEVRDGTETTLRDVLNKIEGTQSFREDDPNAYFFNVAFRNWKAITKHTWAIHLPNYVNEDNGAVIKPAQQLDETQKLVALVELEARHEFVKVANHFLPKYALLSNEMTANEVRECARQMNWFKSMEVKLDEELVASNGSLNTEPKVLGGWGITATWLRPYSGSSIGIGTADDDPLSACADETQEQLHDGTEVPLTPTTDTEQYCSWAIVSTQEMETDSGLMPGEHLNDKESESDVVRMPRKNINDTKSEYNRRIFSDSETSRGKQFMGRKNPFTRTAPDAYTESETDSSFVSQRNKSRFAQRAALGTSRMRPTTVLPQHGAGSDTDTTTTTSTAAVVRPIAKHKYGTIFENSKRTIRGFGSASAKLMKKTPSSALSQQKSRTP